ncbi:UV radiation resistance protein and autophagy-related subunit 14-domain-containing protein [Xylariales sp. AK1849]|nr:UV radiation resistance protein and autophagy-related subunit 14-domain-containing protein [Xylariales sp. AK1849]
MCEICQRGHHPTRLPFFCAMDARNNLYDDRVTNARVLMEMAELEERVNTLLQGSQPDSSGTTPNRDTRIYIDNCVSEEQKAIDRTEQIISAAEKLQKEVDKAKREIQDRKAALARRKADITSASHGIAARRNRELEETKKSVRMTKYTWDREYEAMAQYRAALCTEVAKLYRLQRVRRGNPARFEYKIGGIEVVDLLHLSSTNYEIISTSLGHMAHLLWLVSHYLSIRLPAEITLPHNDYPRSTIFTLANSYHHDPVAFPGTSPLPVDLRDQQYSHLPHPRPLFLDKPLSSFTKDESKHYSLFLEGVCLLAYNIVWLCRTQGITVGDNSNSFEDFSCMGRNLYNLLVGSSSLHRNQPGQPLIADANAPSPIHNGNTATENPSELSKATPKMGAYSHGTAHTFLGSAAGESFTRSFKLPSPIKLADKLKARLVDEAPVPEWELIEDDDFGPNDLDDGVMVGETPQSKARNPKYGLESYMSVNTFGSSGTGGGRAPGAAAVTSAANEKDKERSSNGWTKIKPR